MYFDNFLETWTIPCFVAKSFRYLRAGVYQNGMWFDKITEKIKGA